jgi:uncharacterized membrane protein YeaQ/YmgE (transglycosylase-associated protein family)
LEKKELFLNKSAEFVDKEKKLKEANITMHEIKKDLQSEDLETRMKALEKGMERNEKAFDKYGMLAEDALKMNIEKLEEGRISLSNASIRLEEGRIKLEAGAVKVEGFKKLMWTVTNVLFVIGGMIGAFTSKFVAEVMGRKKGILFHYLFTIVGALFVFVAYYVKRPELVMASRFLYGVQGGMSCGLVPTYLNEISPAALRGSTGVIHQLCITMGILISQTLGFRQLLGN